MLFNNFFKINFSLFNFLKSETLESDNSHCNNYQKL